jgi:hypothetical protein
MIIDYGGTAEDVIHARGFAVFDAETGESVRFFYADDEAGLYRRRLLDANGRRYIWDSRTKEPPRMPCFGECETPDEFLEVAWEEIRRPIVMIETGRYRGYMTPGPWDRGGFVTITRTAERDGAGGMRFAYTPGRGGAVEAEADGLPSITCPRCRYTSYHGKDVEDRWCNRCERKIPDEGTMPGRKADGPEAPKAINWREFT